MVRVIPVHNFSGQSVAAIEEPTASCTAKYMGQEMLLLALSSHCVEGHSLTMPQPKVTAVFPTVDSVCQMLHCSMENYVATLESKSWRDGSNVKHFVRIYVNWALAENQNQAMRARIAGRVTPSSNRLSSSLEMIELPLNGEPTRIACCQVTGNLLVATGDTAVLHELKVERQQLSKQKFIDFEARPWSLGFSFIPTHMEIAEDFALIMDRTHFMVFRLLNQLYEDIDLLSSSNSTNSSALNQLSISGAASLRCNAKKNRQTNETPMSSEKCNKAVKSMGNAVAQVLDSEELLTSIYEPGKRDSNLRNTSLCTKMWNSSFCLRSQSNVTSYLDWDRLASNKSEEQWLITNKIINEKSQPLNIELPALNSESKKPGLISNPFITNAPELHVVIKTSSPTEGWSENYVVKNLLQLKISNLNQQKSDNSEYFTCSLLKPMYLKNEDNTTHVKKCTLRSERYKYFNGINCIVCTVQEGYLFHFSASSYKDSGAVCTPYPFTAPVNHIVLEDTVLHALTEAGLESYTLRLPHNMKISSSSINLMENPSNNDIEPISLIGLRPFIGVERLLHVNRYIVLLTQADFHWTLYTLSLPSPEDLYHDIMNAAINHKNSSSSTYRHLLGEAYTVISLAKDVENHEIENTLSSVRSSIEAKNSSDRLNTLYYQACGLLGEYYINSETPAEWRLCIEYFKVSGLKPAEILSKKSVRDAPGLGTYLTETLLNLKSGQEADDLFQIHNIAEIISSTSKENLIRLIFGSLVLREYATEKLISVILSIEQDDPAKFALVLLYVQAGRQEQAENIIKPISDNCILSMCLTNWHCLFDVTFDRQSGNVIATFSDLSIVLMRQKSLIFADVLMKVIDARAISLHQILQIFLAHLPSRVGRDGHVAAAALQLFVETYLRNYFDLQRIKLRDAKNNDKMHYDYSIIEAFKILVRSYLGKLTQTNVYTIEDNRKSIDTTEDNEYLFKNLRPLFLEIITTANDSTQELKDSPIGESKQNQRIVRTEALKLQALLASGYLPEECLQEVKEFLQAHSIDGALPFRILCIKSTEEATLMLMENCPQAILQYAKERYTDETEWKYLIRLLYDKIAATENNPNISSLLDNLLEDTLIHLARTVSLKGLQRLLSNDSMTILQRYGDICSQIIHADHVNSMIIGTGQHLLFNINV